MAFNWIKFPWTNLHDLNLDWIIQTVKTLEDNLSDALALVQTTVDTAITKLLTGSGDLTINKTGDVRISGNSVQLSKTVISSGSEQLTMHNPTSNTSMTANYSSGVLRLTNNQNLEAGGVAIYPINTPADGGVDNSTFAANVGYVKTAVEAVSTALATETENRTSGDAALQSTIDNVKTLLNIESNARQENDAAIRQKTIFNINANISDEFTGGNITLDSTVISQLKGALSNVRLVSLALKNNTVQAGIYETLYLLLDSYTSPPEANGEYDAYFYNVGKTLSATINTATGVLTYSKV